LELVSDDVGVTVVGGGLSLLYAVV